MLKCREYFRDLLNCTQFNKTDSYRARPVFLFLDIFTRQLAAGIEMSTAGLYSSHAVNHKLTGSMITLTKRPDPTLEYGNGSAPSRLPTIRNGARRRSLSATRSVTVTGTNPKMLGQKISSKHIK